jgi:hypothetical protein
MLVYAYNECLVTHHFTYNPLALSNSFIAVTLLPLAVDPVEIVRESRIFYLCI